MEKYESVHVKLGKLIAPRHVTRTAWDELRETMRICVNFQEAGALYRHQNDRALITRTHTHKSTPLYRNNHVTSFERRAVLGIASTHELFT